MFVDNLTEGARPSSIELDSGAEVSFESLLNNPLLGNQILDTSIPEISIELIGENPVGVNDHVAHDSVSAQPANDKLNETRNIVHPDWEQIDPTPDINVLFKHLSRKFFEGKLDEHTVDIIWSKKMTSTAGSMQPMPIRKKSPRRARIALSEPLLKFRSRKNIVEILLVEFLMKYQNGLGYK